MSNPGTTNLVSWWSLDETSGNRADSHGSNTLTDNGSVGSAAGKQSNGADFEDTSSQSLTITSNSTLQTGNTDFTFGGWFKFESLTGFHFLMGKNDHSSGREYSLIYDHGNTRFDFYIGNGASSSAFVSDTSVATPATATWYFIVAWYDSSATTIYIQVNNDGTPDSNASLGITPATGSSQFAIGKRSDNSDWYLDGIADECFLYKRVLTAAERTWLYNSGAGRSYGTINQQAVSSGPRAKLGAVLYKDSTKAQLLADWSHIIQGVEFETDEHGYGFLSAFVPMPMFDAFRFYNGVTVPHLIISDGAFIAYEGRVEDIAIVDGGIQIGAYGYWRAMFDTPYTALWTDTRYRNWEIVGEEDSSLRTPAKYYMDNNNRLYVSLRQGETYTNNADYGSWYYEVPDEGRNDATRLEYDYDVTLPTNWKLIISSFAEGFTSGVTETTVVTGNGSNQTGSNQAEAITASKQIVVFSLLNQTGGDYTNSGETDDWYASVTNVRVMGSTGDASNEMHADEIVNDLISAVNALNSTQLDSSTALVSDPGVDLQNESYEDLLPGDIAVDLAERGDGSTPPLRYETGVWEDQQLYFRERGSMAQDWYTELSSLSISGTIDTVYNSAYAVYRDVKNFPRRTADSDDTPSQKRYGITRKISTPVKTTSATQAAITRDTVLDDSKDITPRGSITISSITGQAGGSFPLYIVRAGDTITVQNLPPIDSATTDKIRKFVIKRTRYFVDEDILEVVPELDPPSLDILVSQKVAASGPVTEGPARF